jgi:hypothetical protein
MDKSTKFLELSPLVAYKVYEDKLAAERIITVIRIIKTKEVW